VKKFFSLAVIAVSVAGAAAAQHAVKGEFKETLHAKLDPALESYKPSMKVEGEIRSIGADTMEDLTKFWIEGFTRVHSGAKFTMEAKASGTAVPGLTDGKADVGPCAREVLPPELGPFEKKFGYKPFAVRVASGSYRTPGKTHAIAFLVHKDNPIKHLTFEQIESLYAASPAKPALTTWGQLGLTGEWASKKIALWGLIRPNGIANFIQYRVMANGGYKTGINERTTVGSLAALDAVAQGVAADKNAIGYGGFGNLIDGVKAVALSEAPDGPYYEGTFDEVVRHKYPLSRYIYIYINRAPGKPIEPKVKEYLSYILSKEGQEAVAREGVFLPLTAAAVKAERARLQ
jgi:phosphate transport system substrate-binding protein